MPKEMLINVSAGEECRIAVVENGKLEELYMERASSVSHVGNVYKGKVTNVEASIQAAFVDFGIGRNGFLHISDLMPSYFGRGHEGVKESVGRKMARRDRPPIQHCLRRGDEIIVQVIKEGLGTKGPTLSSYLSIPGRILVMMPGVGKSGVSKKIEDDEERRRLRKILDELDPPKDAGFIIRTAGVGKAKAEIERDFKYLMRLWENIQKAEGKKGPLELYAEGDLVMRTVRDVYTSDIDRIVVDDKDTAKRIKDFFKLLMPRTKNKVEVYDETSPLFHSYKIERDIEMMHSRTVPLPSGGSLVIDQTEAVVAIDVNSGKSRESKDAETTAFKTDIEAADEIPRQLKLRDLGGVVICDFIDLRFERHRRELEERLAENLKKDRAKTRFLAMSEFGIIEMTRQRMRPSLKKSVFHDCPHCAGHGLVKSPESMGLDVTRKLAIAAGEERVVRVELYLHPDVAVQVLNRKRLEIAKLEDDSQKKIVIKIDESLPLDQMRFELFDEREGMIWLKELGMEPPQHGGGRDNRGGQHPRRHDQRPPRREERRDDHREEFSDDSEEPAAGLPPREPDTQPREAREPYGESRRGHRNDRRNDRRDNRRDEPRNAPRNEPRNERRDDSRKALPDADVEPIEADDLEPIDAPVEGAHGEGFDDQHDADGSDDRGEPQGQNRGDDHYDDRRDDNYQGGQGGQGGPYNDGQQGSGEGGSRRRRRRRRRGRRGRGGSGGQQGFNPQGGQYGGQQGGGGGQGGGQWNNNPRRPEVYSNDPGVEEFADEGDVQPQDARRDGGPQGGEQGGGQGRGQPGGRHPNDRSKDRYNDRGGRRDDRRDEGNRAPRPEPVRVQSDDPEDDPMPGNSIHDPEPVRVKPAAKGGRRGRRGRGRGKTPQEITQERLPQVTSDSLVARFLEAPVAVPDVPDDVEDDIGNRAAPEPAGEPEGEAEPKRRRRRGGRGRGGKGKADKPQAREVKSERSRSVKALESVEKTGTSDAHAIDDPHDKHPDVSEFLKPATPHDLDYLPEYEDDE